MRGTGRFAGGARALRALRSGGTSPLGATLASSPQTARSASLRPRLHSPPRALCADLVGQARDARRRPTTEAARLSAGSDWTDGPLHRTIVARLGRYV